MLYLIGVGLSSIEDITLKGLKIIKKCDYVYIDSYTSILSHGVDEIEKLINKPVQLADRECVEQTNILVDYAKQNKVAFLVVGDPLTATTHLDLLIRCLDANVAVKVIHNASILNAVGCCGLQLYEFGETVSISIWNELAKPESYYDKIEHNYRRGLHTLCLLDIQVKEKSIENILKRREIFEPPRYMTCQQAADQILQIILRRHEASTSIPHPDAVLPFPITSIPILKPENLVIGLARVGSDDRIIAISSLFEMARTLKNKSTPISQLLDGPLHSIIIPGRLQPLEIEWLTARERHPDNLAGDSLPYIFVSLGPDQPAASFDLSNMTNKLKEERKKLVDSMLEFHCNHAVKTVMGDTI